MSHHKWYGRIIIIQNRFSQKVEPDINAIQFIFYFWLGYQGLVLAQNIQIFRKIDNYFFNRGFCTGLSIGFSS
ncbi:MAG TPA: hypothetical protein DF427_05285 [Moraxellaceae bacterium]|nr:hypothetical protein [Moraxellaceae bacterium]